MDCARAPAPPVPSFGIDVPRRLLKAKSGTLVKDLTNTSWAVRHGWLPIAAILLLGLWLDQHVEGKRLLEAIDAWAPAGWVAPALVVAQALCFALALPGSVSFVVIGLVYDPLPATLMILIGGTTGSSIAYYLSHHISRRWAEAVQHRALFRLLKRNSNFMMLCAIRILPGFPHSVLNYGAGLLRVPFGRFVLSAVLGYIVKGMLYATILHRIMDAHEMQEPFSLATLWPMALLAVLFFVGFAFQKAWQSRTTDQA